MRGPADLALPALHAFQTRLAPNHRRSARPPRPGSTARRGARAAPDPATHPPGDSQDGEQLPVVGLGGANTFSETALRESRTEDYESVGAILRALVDGGGAVFDTAYGYGASEQVAGQVAQDLGIADRIWWATKMNAARVSGGASGPADLDEARYQLQRSFLRLRRRQVDLFQVHNMGDPPAQLALLKQLKAEGFVRYVGITTTFEGQYAALAGVMRSEPVDFIGIDYAVDNRTPEEVIFPSRSSAGSACWPTSRSAGTGCGPGSVTGRCRSGPPSSTPIPGLSSCSSS